MFDQIVPDENLRKKIYQVVAAVGLLLGAIQVAYLAIPDAVQPAWLTAALAVYTFLGGGSAVLSQANTKSPPVVKVVAQPVAEEGVSLPGPVGDPNTLSLGSPEPTGVGLMSSVDPESATEMTVEEAEPAPPGKHAA